MRRRRLRRRRAVRRCARFRRAGRCGRFGRRHRAVVRLCAPFRRAGVRDDEYVGFCRRTARGRTHRPRSMPRGRRCADRAGYGFSADGSSAGRVARLDADVYDDSRPGAVFGATPVFRGSFSSALRPWRRYAGLPTRFRTPGSRRSCTGRFASHTAGSAT